MNTTIDLIITLRSPLHISSGHKGYYVDPDTGYITRKKSGFPVTRTAFHVLPRGDGDTRSEEIPVIPGNTLRGLMRRCVADTVFDRCIASGASISLESYHSLTCGNRSAKLAPTNNVLEFVEKRKHPVVGLLGGTPSMVPSSMVTGLAFPVTDRSMDLHLVPGWSANFAKQFHSLTQTVFFARKDDALRLKSGAKTLQLVTSFGESMSAYIAATAKKPTTGDSDNAESERGLTTFSAIELIAEGLSFHSRFAVDSTMIGSEGLGLFFSGLEKLANHQRIGGRSALGYGRYQMQAFLLEGNSRTSIIDLDENTHTHRFADHPFVQDALACWNEYDLDIPVMERLL